RTGCRAHRSGPRRFTGDPDGAAAATGPRPVVACRGRGIHDARVAGECGFALRACAGGPSAVRVVLATGGRRPGAQGPVPAAIDAVRPGRRRGAFRGAYQPDADGDAARRPGAPALRQAADPGSGRAADGRRFRSALPAPAGGQPNVVAFGKPRVVCIIQPDACRFHQCITQVKDYVACLTHHARSFKDQAGEGIDGIHQGAGHPFSRQRSAPAVAAGQRRDAHLRGHLAAPDAAPGTGWSRSRAEVLALRAHHRNRRRGLYGRTGAGSSAAFSPVLLSRLGEGLLAGTRSARDIWSRGTLWQPETFRYLKSCRERTMDAKGVPEGDLFREGGGTRHASAVGAVPGGDSTGEKYWQLFAVLVEGFCIIEVLFVADDAAVDYFFIEHNAAFERLSGLSDVVGRRIRELAPRHEQAWFDAFGRVALTGVPERFELRADAMRHWYDVYAFRVDA